MKVSEAIDLLLKQDPDAELVVNGHSDGEGYNSVSNVHTLAVEEDQSWQCEYIECDHRISDAIKVVWIG